MSLTVACVLKLGGCYTKDWVHALKRGLRRHLPLEHEFVCLTDDSSIEPYWRIPLKHGWPGWWSKLELFRPDVFAPGTRVLYLDLDTLPVGDLSEIAAYAGGFAMLSDFYQPRTVGSGVMAWPAEQGYAVYQRFMKEGARRSPGRSDPFYVRVFGTKIERLQAHFPGQIVSLKIHCNPARAKGPPPGARLVCFHGRPRPNDLAAGWAHKAWKEIAVRCEQ